MISTSSNKKTFPYQNLHYATSNIFMDQSYQFKVSDLKKAQAYGGHKNSPYKFINDGQGDQSDKVNVVGDQKLHAMGVDAFHNDPMTQRRTSNILYFRPTPTPNLDLMHKKEKSTQDYNMTEFVGGSLGKFNQTSIGRRGEVNEKITVKGLISGEQKGSKQIQQEQINIPEKTIRNSYKSNNQKDPSGGSVFSYPLIKPTFNLFKTNYVQDQFRDSDFPQYKAVESSPPRVHYKDTSNRKIDSRISVQTRERQISSPIIPSKRQKQDLIRKNDSLKVNLGQLHNISDVQMNTQSPISNKNYNVTKQLKQIYSKTPVNKRNVEVKLPVSPIKQYFNTSQNQRQSKKMYQNAYRQVLLQQKQIKDQLSKFIQGQETYGLDKPLSQKPKLHQSYQLQSHIYQKQLNPNNSFQERPIDYMHINRINKPAGRPSKFQTRSMSTIKRKPQLQDPKKQKKGPVLQKAGQSLMNPKVFQLYQSNFRSYSSLDNNPIANPLPKVQADNNKQRTQLKFNS